MDFYPCIWAIFASVCLVAVLPGDAARPHDHPLGKLIRRARNMDPELHKVVTKPRPVRSVFDYNWNKATDTATSTTPSTTPPETPPPTEIPTTAAPPTTEATTTTTTPTTATTTTTTKAIPVNPNYFGYWDFKKMNWWRKHQMASKKLQQQLANMAKKQRKLFGHLKIPGLSF